jgi:serine/threonine protein kinase
LGDPLLSTNSLIISNRLPALGKYRLIAEIGHGGMAEVFLAVMEGPGQFSKLIALKVLRSQFAEDPEGRAMFLDEARLAARLNHSNVVQTYEVGEANKRHYIAMEYLEGQPYSRILHRARTSGQPTPMAMSLRILAECLAGLHYAHELKDFDGTPLRFVHRDVSPHNIFVTYDGTIKVLDFGIAKAVGGTAETRTGVLKGKVGYMAPEQLFDDTIDRRADIYAAGVMLWEACAGRRLWTGASDVAVLTKVANEKVPSLRTVNPNVSEELDRICLKACARKREERYQSAADFQNDIEEYLTTLHERALPRDVGKYVSERFADLKEETRSLIEMQLAKVKTSGTGEFEPIALPTATGSSPSLRNPGEPTSGMRTASGSVQIVGVPASSSTNDGQVSTPVVAAEPPKPGNKKVIVGVLVAALVAAGVIGVVAFSGGKPGTAVAGPATTTATAAATTTGAVTATAVGTPTGQHPAVGTIDLNLSATPSDAKIFFDEEQLPTNPFVKKLTKDGSEHTLRAEASGFETSSEKVVANGDKTVVLRLSKSAAKQTADTPAPQNTAPPAATTPAATADPPKKNVVKIDTDNPFEKK